jgi:hypothetical protein
MAVHLDCQMGWVLSKELGGTRPQRLCLFVAHVPARLKVVPDFIGRDDGSGIQILGERRRSWPGVVLEMLELPFEGAVSNLYATLAVRLARSRIFTQPEIYRNVIQYSSTYGGYCGLIFRNSGEGVASLTVFFSDDAPDVARVLFEDFIADHLKGALNARREPVFSCTNPECGLTTITPEAAHRIREKGQRETACNVCGMPISLIDSHERLKIPLPSGISELRAEADHARQIQAWLAVRRATKSYDMFLSYNSADRAAVHGIAQQLIEKGVMPWLYEWDEVAGERFIPAIERAIGLCSSAAFLLSDNKLGNWQSEEADALIRETKKRRDFAIIPVVLPGTTGVPGFPHFIGNRDWVDFRLSEPNPLKRLVDAANASINLLSYLPGARQG